MTGRLLAGVAVLALAHAAQAALRGSALAGGRSGAHAPFGPAGAGAPSFERLLGARRARPPARLGLLELADAVLEARLEGPQLVFGGRGLADRGGDRHGLLLGIGRRLVHRCPADHQAEDAEGDPRQKCQEGQKCGDAWTIGVAEHASASVRASAEAVEQRAAVVRAHARRDAHRREGVVAEHGGVTLPRPCRSA
jgi:hypothetical protein